MATPPDPLPLPLPESLPLERFHAWLGKRGVRCVYHANTVTTALTFLKLGRLVSRARAVRDRLQQIEQFTDGDDQVYSIFDKLFFDPMDIHQRKWRWNLYGPVTFEFDIDLLRMDRVREVRLTRKNPSRWRWLKSVSERWLETPADVKAKFDPTGYDNHLVLTCDEEFLPLSPHLKRMILDNPPVAAGLFQPAFDALADGLKDLGVAVEARVCPGKYCKCKEGYKDDLDGFRLP